MKTYDNHDLLCQMSHIMMMIHDEIIIMMIIILMIDDAYNLDHPSSIINTIPRF